MNKEEQVPYYKTPEYHAKWYQNHREAVSIEGKLHHEKNREKDNARSNLYYEGHKEEARIKSAQYRAEHKGEIKSRSKQYSEANKEKIRAKALAYNRAHPEVHRSADHKYSLSHKDQLQAKQRAWQQTHPEIVQVRNARRKALKYGNTPIGEMLTEAQWRGILDQFNYSCAYCGRKMERLTIDHIIPLSKGGPDSLRNVVPCCPRCNSAKRNKGLLEWVTYFSQHYQRFSDEVPNG